MNFMFASVLRDFKRNKKFLKTSKGQNSGSIFSSVSNKCPCQHERGRPQNKRY